VKYTKFGALIYVVNDLPGIFLNLINFNLVYKLKRFIIIHRRNVFHDGLATKDSNKLLIEVANTKLLTRMFERGQLLPVLISN